MSIFNVEVGDFLMQKQVQNEMSLAPTNPALKINYLIIFSIPD